MQISWFFSSLLDLFMGLFNGQLRNLFNGSESRGKSQSVFGSTVCSFTEESGGSVDAPFSRIRGFSILHLYVCFSALVLSRIHTIVASNSTTEGFDGDSGVLVSFFSSLISYRNEGL